MYIYIDKSVVILFVTTKPDTYPYICVFVYIFLQSTQQQNQQQALMNKSNDDVRRKRPETTRPNHILLFTIINPFYPITVVSTHSDIYIYILLFLSPAASPPIHTLYYTAILSYISSSYLVWSKGGGRPPIFYSYFILSFSARNRRK